VQRYLWAADVFLSLSELSNVGNPLLEAMLSGRCILTLDVGDTGKLIRNGETGVLLRTESPAVISEALEKLAGDRAKRDRLAAGALEYAKTNFWSWDERIAAEIDAVEALVAQPQAVSADV
jgi:glycosyltransferase involved in cell wall biosynthesis